jgi:hypothetical protein
MFQGQNVGPNHPIPCIVVNPEKNLWSFYAQDYYTCSYIGQQQLEHHKTDLNGTVLL